MNENIDQHDGVGFGPRYPRIAVIVAALAYLHGPDVSVSQEAPVYVFDPAAVERALASLDVDLKFVALNLVQRGLVKDIVTAQVWASADEKTNQPAIFIDTGFTIVSETELTKAYCTRINREIQKWILGGPWREIPSDGQSASDGSGRTAEAVRQRELPTSVQLTGMIRRFKGYVRDVAADLAMSPAEFGAELRKYEPVYNSLRIGVSLLGPDYANTTAQARSVACSNQDGNN